MKRDVNTMSDIKTLNTSENEGTGGEELPPKKDKWGFFRIKDRNPGTFINEELWKVFLFRLFAYVAPIVAGSIVVVGESVAGFSFSKFLWGVTLIVIPLFAAASEAQANNRRNQIRISEEEKRISLEKRYTDKIDNLDVQNEKLRKQLDEKWRENYLLQGQLDAKATQTEALTEAISRINEKLGIKE